MTQTASRHDINAERARKELSLRRLAELAEVNYYRACRVLKGRSIDKDALVKLARAVKRAPMPLEGVCR